jgi:hypothetical protein
MAFESLAGDETAARPGDDPERPLTPRHPRHEASTGEKNVRSHTMYRVV